ncbi:DNA-processing protein DprA [Aureimonas leprariae]|uniref:DNA-protecting protein DprA n=1 Tax=Plantimonas leprariae TaxID=2615207 RepID=A0A7V7PS44_9HYPH|nr:DNA-processing protein DprA [Aureimonas leprariae]KAB0681841.1 DNA-protecting protein DprA [Aureimonas leprariae]
MKPSAASAQPPRLDETQRLAWLRLIRSENVGPASFRALINRFGGAEAALAALPDLAARGGSKRRIVVAGEDVVAAELARASKLGARFLFRGEPDYPPMLVVTEAAPPVVAVMGAADIFLRPAVAIVGARNASLSGIKLTRQLAAELGGAGFATVSGLARGIDAAAHEASLASGTIGIFAGGLDKPYPKENGPLMRRIVDGGGCLLSEMPFGWEPRAVDFPRRNRIVAALGLGLLVVEAALRSGSLISARLAGELGRHVFAVPGSPLDPRAGGTNKLLKDGAILVTEVSDIVDALRPLGSVPVVLRSHVAEDAETASGDPTESDRSRVLRALSPVPAALDDILAHADIHPGALQLILLELDLAGRLERHSGGRVSLLSGST